MVFYQNFSQNGKNKPLKFFKMKKHFLALTVCFFGFAVYLGASCVTAYDSNTGLSDTTCYKDGSNDHFIFHDGTLVAIKTIE